MKFTLIIGDEQETRDFPDETTIKRVLEDMDFPLETVVVKKNGQIVLEEEIIADGDVIEVIKVIYGG
ncbi:MAG: MoaD/ThiS family protein [Methanobacteriaceae archaeon]|nr:MoaD/ThiS family protein [Methanobacteriaceae archaeon]MDP2835937.1 MoaD/ThiS family protein [Methanobacteriaceae archaeon]MDP3035292.1 MoaD/ThiS family protein [Methanobacteriaceae archaeon]MDP3485700.1 MoaD/ThiS family protein [Methanobacteriaceae archaeon]MDP3623787.1 MoaD/ThiS family protein [Methanobacteriaceae archaeon]